LFDHRNTFQYIKAVEVPSHPSHTGTAVSIPQPDSAASDLIRIIEEIRHLELKMNSTDKDMSQLPEVVTPPPSDGISPVGSPPPDYKYNPAQPVANFNYSTPSPMPPPPQQGPPPGAYVQPPQMYPQQQQSFQGNPEQYAKARARTAKSKGFCGGILATLACCCCVDYCCCC